MGINECYNFVKAVSGKDARGALSPAEFNSLAPIAQIEAISDRLTNLKKIDKRMMPQYGYKSNRKIISELRLVLSGPTPMEITDGRTSYPCDYFYPDSMHTDDLKHIDMIESDEYPHIKQSLIFPPDNEHPVAVFYGDYILIDPAVTTMLNYIKYPENPVWAFTGDITPVYDPENSVDLIGDRSFGIDVCRRILKFMGINLNSDLIANFAKQEELSN